MASNIKGINIEIGGNTVGLEKALSGVNKKSRDLQSELRQVEKLLKLDPKNTELLAQKQKLLSESVENAKNKLDNLKEAEKQVQKQFEKGEISEKQYRALQREIVKTGQELSSYSDKIDGLKPVAKTSFELVSEKIKETEKNSDNLNKELSEVNELIKFNPKNTELLSQKQKILSESVENTKEKLNHLKEAERQAQEQFKKGEISEAQYRALQREIVKTEDNLKALEKQAEQANDNLQKISKVASDIGKSTEDLGKKALPASLAVTGIGTAAVMMANNFDDALADINTLLDDESHLENYRKKIRQISDDLNVDLKIVADGMYQTISSIGDGVDTSDIFSTMAKSAKAGGAETTDAVALISAAMKGYGTVNDETAKKISDLAFETAKLGVTTFPEMSKSMQPLFPVAKQLNISMEELFGVMATGTGVTGNTSEVTTQFKAVMSGLMKPTKDMSELIGKYGYSNAQAMIESEGLAGVLKILQDETGGQTDKMAKLFGSTEALTLVSALTGSQFDTFSEKLLAMGDAAGATDVAFEKKQTQSEKLSSSINKIKNSAIDLGIALQPVFDVIAGVFEKIASKIKELSPLQIKMIATIGTIIAVIGPLLIIIGKIATGFGAVLKVVNFLLPVFKLLAPVFAALTSPVSLVVAAITALVGAFIYLWNTSEGFRNFFIECWDIICTVISARAEEIKVFFTETIPNAFNAFKDATLFCFEAVGNFISNLVNNIVLFFTITIPQTFQNFLNWLGTFFVTDWTTKFGAIGLVINLFRDKVKAVFTAITLIFQDIISFIKNIFTGNWSAAWQNVVDMFGTIFNTMKDLALAPINFVLGLVNSVINAVKDALEWLSKLGKKKKDVDDDNGGGRPRKMRMMAKGGVLTNGEAIVAEAGPELIQMINGRAVVTPLTKSSTNTEVNTAKGRSTGGGGDITVNVYSPKALTAPETARQFKRVQRQLALGV